MSRDSYIHRIEAGVPGRPLVFALHGTGGGEDQLLALARDLVPGGTIVSPRGDVSEHGAARFFRRTGEGVYDMDDLARATGKMVGFVEAHRAEARANRTFGIGYSNGANILATTMFARPDLFDAAVLMHPLIPFEPQIEGSLAGKRILITAAGSATVADEDLRGYAASPCRPARLESWLVAAGADVTLDWHPGGHEVRPEELSAAKAFLAHSLPAPAQGERA